jgi:HSP20 family protein
MLERAATPSMNVYQKGDDWTLTFDLPGVRKEDVEIEIHGDRLRVAAERRPLFADDSNVERHRVERSEGRFERVLQLPFTIDSEKVKATTEHGILTVALSPRDSDKPRKVLLS